MTDTNESLIIKKKLSLIDKRSNIEIIRSELFSIATIVLLSSNFFPHNINIKIFCDSLKLPFGDYLYKSRTLLLARFLRELKKAEKDRIYEYLDSFKKLVFISDKENDKDIIKGNSNKDNYIDELLNSFSRGNLKDDE